MADIVFFIGPLPPPMNGAAMTSQGFVAALRTYGRIRICNIAPDAKRRGGLALAVKPLRVASAAIGMVASSWRRKKAIYTALDGGFGLIYGIVIVAVARLCRYRIYMHHHSFAYINFPSVLLRMLANIAGPRATHILLCPLMAERIQQAYPAIKTVRIVDSTAFVPQMQPYQKQRERELQIGLLSNLNAEKGLDISINLLRESLRQGLPVRLVLAGRAHDTAAKATLNSAIAEFGEHLEYLGPISDKEKDMYFRKLDVFLFPTQYINEAQPRVILEALSYGVPVITRARSCIPGDVGPDAGLCIAEHLDFVEAAISTLRTWIENPGKLGSASDAAIKRSHALHANAKRQLYDAAREITGA